MAVVTTKKSGFREINGLDSDHFASAPDPDHPGGTIWTATDNAGLVGIAFGKDDTQTHGTDPAKPGQPPLKTGSTVKEWVDQNGIRHVEVGRVK